MGGAPVQWDGCDHLHLTACHFRDHEGRQESKVLQVNLGQKAPGGKLASWDTQDTKEKREIWVHLDHL